MWTALPEWYWEDNFKLIKITVNYLMQWIIQFHYYDDDKANALYIKLSCLFIGHTNPNPVQLMQLVCKHAVGICVTCTSIALLGR